MAPVPTTLQLIVRPCRDAEHSFQHAAFGCAQTQCHGCCIDITDSHNSVWTSNVPMTKYSLPSLLTCACS